MSGEQKGLAPCPFCGRQPKVTDYHETSDETGERYGYAAVECDHDGDGDGDFLVLFHADTLENAKTAWNTRVSPAPDQAVGAEPVGWRHRWPIPHGSGEWHLDDYDPRSHLGESKVIEIEPLYSAATLSALQSQLEGVTRERDEARAMFDECAIARDASGFLGTVPECIAHWSASYEAAESALATARAEALEEAAKLVETDMRRASDSLRLTYGELSAQEIRTLRAVAGVLAGAIRRLSPGAHEDVADAYALDETAATLTSLESENARLREVLKPFARLADMEDMLGTKDGESMIINVTLTRAARAALSLPTPGGS